MPTKNIYKYWDTEEALHSWASARPWDKRFRSERHFFERIFRPGMSVLDVGCANGDLHLGLLERFGKHMYTGIDTSEAMIEAAKKLCPDAKFYVGNINERDILGDAQYDVVTATGVFQHEPEYKKLLTNMLRHTKDGGFVLFDFKLFHTHPGISDINQAYCDLPDRLYFNVLNFQDAIVWLKNIGGISSIEMFGYYSGTHKSVVLPETVDEEVCSAHVLLKKERSAAIPKINVELPEGYRL